MQEITNKIPIVMDTQSVEKIREALNQILYVPSEQIKPRIIEELLLFFQETFQDKHHDLKVFIAYQGERVSGFVTSMVDPQYSSYSRKCGTFGWLTVYDFDTCKLLLTECEKHVKSHKIRKIRGNINYPKRFGGLGIQDKGFFHDMMYGVAFDDPASNKLEFLEKMGYEKESEYACMHVTQRLWSKGKTLDEDIRVGHITLGELIKRKGEILDIAQNSFYTILPDAPGGENRLDEIIETYKQVPKSFYKIKEGFNPKTHTDIPYILEAWNSYDTEKVNTWVHCAFDRKTDKLVGAIFCLPDLYEDWLGKPITRANVDTAVVRKEYAGKGIFSALNNLGRLTLEMSGIKYFEGTTIWYNNQDAVNSIFPHCTHIRRHYVVQKRIR